MNREQLEEIRALVALRLAPGVPRAGWRARLARNVPALLDEIDRLREQLRLANRAKAHLFARIIASSHLLEKPFTNAPDQSPWTKVSFAMSALTEALTTAEGGTSKGSEAVAKPYQCPGCGARYRTAEHAAGCADDHVPTEGGAHA